MSQGRVGGVTIPRQSVRSFTRARRQWMTPHGWSGVSSTAVEDGVSMELNALCIHEAKASFYLSKELLMRH
jgi:hypothetical protein